MKVILMLLTILIPTYCHSAPSVSSASVSGGVLSIGGTDFGAKTTAAPFLYDNFEDGTLGQNVPDTQSEGGWYTEPSGVPSYNDTEQRYTGRQNAMQEYTSYWGSGLYLWNDKDAETIPTGTTEVYVAGWFWMETWEGDSTNVKIINMGSDFGWQTRIDVYPSGPSGHLYAYLSSGCGSGGQVDDNRATPATVMLPDQQWHRIETYLKIGPSGYRDVWVDGDLVAEISGAFTGVDCSVSYIMIGHHFEISNGAKGRRYWDELYVDLTPARVEICTGSTWADKGLCEIQLPTAWGTTSITATYNEGTLDATQYVYVVDEDNTANAFGYSLAFYAGSKFEQTGTTTHNQTGTLQYTQ